jgi:hypothetical protein
MGTTSVRRARCAESVLPHVEALTLAVACCVEKSAVVRVAKWHGLILCVCEVAGSKTILMSSGVNASDCRSMDNLEHKNCYEDVLYCQQTPTRCYRCVEMWWRK